MRFAPLLRFAPFAEKCNGLEVRFSIYAFFLREVFTVLVPLLGLTVFSLWGRIDGSAEVFLGFV